MGSPPFPRTALVVLRTPRSASLTASSEGKAAATSGSSRTKLLPLRRRATYFPRTPPFIDAKSYSGRRSSSPTRLALLIEFSLAPRRSTGADDTDSIVSFRVCHNQDAPATGCADGHETRLVLGVRFIWKRGREWIVQDRCGLVKGDTVPLEVRRCLDGIPFELHRKSIRPRRTRSSVCRTLMLIDASSEFEPAVRSTAQFGVSSRRAYSTIAFVLQVLATGAEVMGPWRQLTLKRPKPRKPRLLEKAPAWTV